MKDKEWLKDEVARIYDTRDYWSVDDLRDEILDSINELDEPEVLSQELPVIPKYVADWIEENGSIYGKNILDIGRDFYEADLGNFEVEDWIEHNIETFIRAWLDGYKIEEESLFYVYLGDGHYLVSEGELREPYAKIRHLEYSGFMNHVTRFTEQEIKDYDPRYWAFRNPVEEVPND